MTSYSPADIETRYCGACHRYEPTPIPPELADIPREVLDTAIPALVELMAFLASRDLDSFDVLRRLLDAAEREVIGG